MRRLVLTCGLGLLALPGCAKFASELDRLPEAELELSSLQPRGEQWSCLDEPVSAATDQPGALTYSFSVIDFVTDAPLADVSVRACYRADVNCDNPVSELVLPDADGRVNVTAFSGFNGYLEITSSGMLPLLAFFAAPWSPALLEQLQRFPVRLLPLPSIQALGASARTTLDPESGMIGVVTYDCQGARARDVRVEIDTPALPYTFVDDLPIVNQELTSDQGFMGFVNVTPGVVLVRSYARGGADPFSVESLLVRPGWSSSVSLLPAFR